ncbi:putative tail fiber protein [Pseudomonas phage Ep4]|uniref:Tail fiber protein n=1 Tax=Pseudomonas phage Ep4 TaxID=3057492 RepID=A0AAU9EZD4_9CAUD|nr:putative tail fiber protein [Pseudomonas phage Ep4]
MPQTGPLQIKRGTTAKVMATVPASGELVLDTSLNNLRVGDGVTAGGQDITRVGSAQQLSTPRTLSYTGDATGSSSFDGSGNIETTLTLATSGITPGTYARVTVDSKGRATNGATVLPVAAGGTGSTSTASALIALGAAPLDSPSFTGTPAAPTPAVGTNSTRLATAAMVQAEIANKRAWTTYTPVITPNSGTYTNASATGRYMVAFGICYVQIVLSVTTKGTGTFPTVSLPVAALSGCANHVIPCRENAVNLKMGQGKILASLTGLQLTAYDSTELTADGAAIYVNGSYPIA